MSLATVADFDLPDEILSHILSQSVAYHSVFNHAISLGPESTWTRVLRHKKSLVLVCKRWNRLASPLLYAHVVLRRVSQLQPLIYTLSNSNLGSMVQELTFTESCGIDNSFDTIVPDNPADEELKKQKDLCNSQKTIIRTLPHLCYRLKRLNVRTQITPDVLRHILSDPSLSRIIDFQFGESLEDLPYLQLRPQLSEVADRIRQLSISNIRPELDSGEAIATDVEFPMLEELRITRWIRGFPTNWSLPRLKRLTISTDSPGGFFYHLDTEGLCSFLKKNGAQLSYLALLCFDRGTRPSIDSILVNCPNVQHLVLDKLVPTANSEIQFPSIERLDIYSFHSEWYAEKRTFSDRVACFPSLKSVHFLYKRDFGNLFFLFPLPCDLNPIEVVKEAWSWLDNPRMVLHSTVPSADAGQILVQTVALLMDDEEGSDEDSTYSPSTSDSDSDSESTSTDDAVDDDSLDDF